jgi:hypothetical protein
MAQSIETLRNFIQTSIFGRRLGLDKNDQITGVQGMRFAIEDIQTTVATSAIGYGITRNLTSGSSQNGQHTLQNIPVGGMKILTLASTSTGCQQYTMPSGVTIANTSAGTTGAGASVVSLTYPGASCTLIAETSALYRCIAQTGSTATAAVNSVVFTTST